MIGAVPSPQLDFQAKIVHWEGFYTEVCSGFPDRNSITLHEVQSPLGHDPNHPTCQNSPIKNCLPSPNDSACLRLGACLCLSVAKAPVCAFSGLMGCPQGMDGRQFLLTQLLQKRQGRQCKHPCFTSVLQLLNSQPKGRKAF